MFKEMQLALPPIGKNIDIREWFMHSNHLVTFVARYDIRITASFFLFPPIYYIVGFQYLAGATVRGFQL